MQELAMKQDLRRFKKNSVNFAKALKLFFYDKPQKIVSKTWYTLLNKFKIGETLGLMKPS